MANKRRSTPAVTALRKAAVLAGLAQPDPSPQHNSGEQKEHQVWQAQHHWIEDVSEHRKDVTSTHNCNDETAYGGDE